MNDWNSNGDGTCTFTLSAFDGSNLLASTVIGINVVPEPVTALAGGGGLAGLLLRRRTHV